MVQTSDNGSVEDGNTRVDRLRRVVDEGGEVGIRCESKARDTLVGAVDNEEGTIGKRWVRGQLEPCQALHPIEDLPDWERISI